MSSKKRIVSRTTDGEVTITNTPSGTCVECSGELAERIYNVARLKGVTPNDVVKAALNSFAKRNQL